MCELKSCPFCGNKNIVFGYSATDSNFYIWCNCGIKVPGMRDHVMELWNTRADHAASSGKMVEPLRKWLPGSEPPDGWYWFRREPGERLRLLNLRLRYLPEYEIPSSRVLFIVGAQGSFMWTDEILYGPISEPEEAQ